MKVQFRLAELTAKKSRLEGRRISYKIISDEAKVSSNVVTNMMNNEVKQIKIETLERILKWLNCQPGDLIVLE